MEGALASEPEDRLKSQVTSVLEAQHGSVRTVSLLLASIAYRRPALLPACERLARAFTGQGLYARFSIERTRAHLHSDLEALLKQAMEKTDQDAPPLKAGWPGRYSPLERLEILQSARRAQKGYEGSLRKDLRRPYVDHIVRAIRELVERFDRLSAMGLVVGLWHDMDEENPTFYREQMQALYEEAKTDRERFQFHYLRLGVRMLTRDALPPPLAEDRQAQEAHEARYIEGLVHPGTVYGELAQFKNLTWLFDDKEFQRQIQLVKCVDTLANWGDFPYFFNAEVRLTDQLQELPSKLFNKALRGIIPGMINHPDCRLSQEDTERFYSGMMEKLRSYTALSGARNPQALELRRAAAAAIPELKERIRQNTRFYSDQPGKGSDILRGLVEEHPENVMAAYEEAVAETRKIGRTNTPVAAPGHFQEDGALKEKGGLGIVGDLSPEVKARLKRLQDRLIELLQARNAKLLGKMWFPDVDHLTIAGLAMEEGFNASQAQNWELVGQACRRAGQVSRFTPQAEATIGNVLRFPFTIAVDVTPDSEQDLETLDGLQTAFGHLVRVLPKYIYHLSIAWIPTHGILETSEADDLNAVLDQLFEEILSDPLGHLTLDAIDVKSFTRLDREQTSHSGIIALRQPSDFKSQIKVGRRILARILGLADAWQLSRPVYQAIVIALLSAFPNLYLQRDAALFAAIGGKVIGEEDEAAIRHKFERRGRFQVFIKSSPAGGEVPLQVEMPSRRLSNLKAILEAIQRSGGDIGALSVPAAGNGGPSVTVTALANRLDTPKADGLIEMLKNLADLPPDESVEARDEVEMKVEIPSGLKPFMTLMEKVLAHEPQIWVESLDLRPWLSDPRKSTLNLKVQIRSGGGERVRKVIGFRSTELMPIPLQTPAGGHGKGAQERVLQQEA
jgi:hypothetical protein